MPDRKKHDLRFFDNLQEYQKLYPSLIPRLERAVEVGNPYVRRAVEITAEASRRAEARQEERLRELFQLTRAQAQIAIFLADGGTIADYAAAANCSVETVRSHLKAIFAKTGVKRQAELAVLVHRTPG